MEETNQATEANVEAGVVKKEKKTYGEWFLALVSFTESSFLPILIDPFLLAMTLARPHHWIRYTLVAGTASVIGGLFGYLIGAVFFDLIGTRLIAFYHLEHAFTVASEAMNDGAFWFTLLGAFTPIPYKLTAIVGGMLHINIFVFILASIIGRFGRFVLVAYVCHAFGEYALKRFSKRFTLVTLAVVGGICFYALMLFLKS